MAILSPADRVTLFAALAEARENGARVSFDPNIRPGLWASMDEVRQVIPQALAVTDIALPSFDDEAAVWGDPHPKATIARLASAGVGEVAVKDGADQFRYCPTIPSRSSRHQRFRAFVIPPGQAMGSTQGICRPDCLGQAPESAVAVAPGFSGDVIRRPGARLPKALVPSLA